MSVQLGSSRRAWLLLVAYVAVALFFGWIAVALGDWVAAVLCLASLWGAVRMASTLRIRSVRSSGASLITGRSSAHSANGDLFVTWGHQSAGARVREGVVVIGPSSAAFLPVGGWIHVALKLATAPLWMRVKFLDLAIDVDTRGADTQALQDAVARHGGFIIDDSWTYASSQRWLVEPGSQGVVWMQHPPHASLTSRWLAVPPPSPERFRSIRNRIASGASALAAAFVFGGVAAWRLAQDVDYLVAGLVYAALVLGAVLGALVVAQRRFGRKAAG